MVRLVDLEGWTPRKTGRRLYRELDDPKAEARSRLKSGRAQLDRGRGAAVGGLAGGSTRGCGATPAHRDQG